MSWIECTMCVLSLRMCKYTYGLRFSFVGVLHTPYKWIYGVIVIAYIIESYIYNVYILYTGLYNLYHTFLRTCDRIDMCYICCRYSRLWAVYLYARTCQRFVFAFAFVSKTEKDNVVVVGVPRANIILIDGQLYSYLTEIIIILLLVLYKARKWNEHSWRSLQNKFAYYFRWFNDKIAKTNIS